MKPPCEVIVKFILPKIRSMIARNLVMRCGLSQEEVASKLGMTQPAINLKPRKDWV